MRYGNHIVLCCVSLVLLGGYGERVFGQGNGKIVFSSDRDGNREIYVMEADGSGQRRLTSNSSADDNPAWSPDGRRIAFISEISADSYDIKLMDPDGTNMAKLHSVVRDTRSGSVCGRVALAWSPDGQRIAFAENGDLYSIDASGVFPPLRLTHHPYCDSEPAWSPDGQTIAFVRGYNFQVPNWSTYVSQIHLIPASGRGRVRTVFGVGYISFAVSAAWSPDGELIVYGFSDAEHYVLRSGRGIGGHVNLSLIPGVLYARWSPDGDKLVFARFNFTTATSGIWTVKSDGVGAQTLLSLEGDYNPSWAPEME